MTAIKKNNFGFTPLDKQKNSYLTGFTLIEVLFASAILLVVIGAVIGIFQNFNKTVIREKKSIELKQKTEMVLNIMVSELKEATNIVEVTGSGIDFSPLVPTPPGMTPPPLPSGGTPGAGLPVNLEAGTDYIIFDKYDPRGAGRITPGIIRVKYFLGLAPDNRRVALDLVRKNLNNNDFTIIADRIAPIPTNFSQPSPYLRFKYRRNPDGSVNRKLLDVSVRSVNLNDPTINCELTTTVNFARSIYPTDTRTNLPLPKSLLKGGF